MSLIAREIAWYIFIFIDITLSENKKGQLENIIYFSFVMT